MRNLAKAAGGEGKIAAYCATVPHPGKSQKSHKPGKGAGKEKVPPGQSERDKGTDDDDVPDASGEPAAKPKASPSSSPSAPSPSSPSSPSPTPTPTSTTTP